MHFATENMVIITSTKPIQMIEWREHLLDHWEEVMKENTRLLVVSGTHGCQDGQLGGNDSSFADQSERQLGWLEKKHKQDIEKKNIKMEVKDISKHKDGRKVDEEFITVLKEFDPTVLLLGFCWSEKSELQDMLRFAGIYAAMILSEDMKEVTQDRYVMLDPGQKEVIKEMASKRWRNVFLWGTNGTGKSLMLCEGVKIKLSRGKREGRDIRVFVTTYDYNRELLRDLERKYLPGIAGLPEVRILGLRELARELGVEWDYYKPLATVQGGAGQAGLLLPPHPGGGGRGGQDGELQRQVSGGVPGPSSPDRTGSGRSWTARPSRWPGAPWLW